uniref:Uncharacterized protein n=1 Tax=Amphilophus citrinellus TaxID=61819 RepID=A0A3Q0RMS5_AMPCI
MNKEKNKLDQQNDTGHTALHRAARRGHTEIMTTLMKGTEDRNVWRKTPLHAAAEKGHASAAVLLLEAGAKINATDHCKDTPLHCPPQM